MRTSGLGSFGWDQTILFLASYLLEKSLSLDNVFVFLMLFKTLQTPRHLQPKILNYGILLALVFRAAFIVAGTLLLHLFAWLMPLLGLFLLWTGVKMLYEEEEEEEEHVAGEAGTIPASLAENPVIQALQWFMPLTGTYDQQQRLFVQQPLKRKGGGSLLPSKSGDGLADSQDRTHASMQCVVLVAIAASDVVFAMDSIPVRKNWPARCSYSRV